jgi:hypothetical protein
MFGARQCARCLHADVTGSEQTVQGRGYAPPHARGTVHKHAHRPGAWQAGTQKWFAA